jgi:cation diffusion facilitator CzcD-associated flavoprotein CzcO
LEEHVQEATTVAVIGAGPAGLAVGACLAKAGLDFVILEKANEVGSSWRRHYARLHLHTVKQYSALPFLPFPESYPRYVPRDLMIRYLENYAAHFDLRPRFAETVHAVRRDGNSRDANTWIIESTSGAIRAPFVVIASGYNAERVSPSFAGMETFKGKVLHSADYVEAKPFSGQSVLVIGMGNTGAEIALDLAEGGARPTISLRNGVHIVPRELFGIPIQMVGMLATSLLPAAVNDRVFPTILDLALGNLAQHGVRRPKQGILQQCASAGRVPVIDVGTVREIFAHAIKIAPDVSAIRQDGASFRDGSSTQYDAIILATGYRPNYQGFLGTNAITPSPGLSNQANTSIHFVGFRISITGLLRDIGKEAVAVADFISSRHSAAPARGRMRSSSYVAH